MTELGQRLKEARIRKELSYEELQEKTKIQKRYLLAIEEGNYSVLPGAFYARAFIKNYAEAVDLDPDILFEEHASDLPKSSEGHTEYTPRSSKSKSSVPKDNKVAKFLPLLLTVVLLAVIVSALYWVIQKNSNDSGAEPNKDNLDGYESSTGEEPAEKEKEADETTDSDGSEDGAGTQSEPEEESPEQSIEPLSTEGIVTTYSLTNTEEFNATLKVSDKAYIDVKDESGKMIQPGGKEFKAGETLNYELTDQTEVTFNIGATQYVAIMVNGKPLEYAVKPADRVHQKIVIQFKKGTSSTQ